jgi:hypothetical protein
MPLARIGASDNRHVSILTVHERATSAPPRMRARTSSHMNPPENPWPTVRWGERGDMGV